ncbi:sensor histidine kinase [Brevirhabdus sp.]|uniref:sensor histidine kinase n=1 Tax=Brevirhabdus sp. TaxID=2004514 RepID=UPI00405851D2
MTQQTDASELEIARTNSWVLRGIVFFLMVIAGITIWMTNALLTERYSINALNRAELRLALYSGNIVSELQRNSVVPLLLSRDPALIGALNSGDYLATSQRLISYQGEIGSASLMLLDEGGRVVAATDRSRLGAAHRNDPYFVEALRANDTVFTSQQLDTGAYNFAYSRRIESEKRGIGVIVVEVDLKKLENRWRGTADAVLVANSEGRVILSTESRWRGRTVEEALKSTSPPSAVVRAIQATADWSSLPDESYFGHQTVLRRDGRIPFQGWKLSLFSSYASVRERVNGVLALEIMGFALLLALTFYLFSRRAVSRSLLFQRESAGLRRLNERLEREIAERERVEKTLEVAEQTLAQSSKLAAMGEMSAAVSHELNQPLAAMKTYLAGAKLLLQRKRPEEALSSFQRIDDLIERMGAITRQLKSYARKGGDAVEPVDMRASVSAALAMMEPQLRLRHVEIVSTMPRHEVYIMADRIRLEQVIINLFRNALDAMNEQEEPVLDIFLSAGKFATLTVRDNGTGIADLDALFDPFYTTKKPGEGVGLGLAISSGIVNDLGGRLTARNAEDGGAVFEVQIPILKETAAAE